MKSYWEFIVESSLYNNEKGKVISDSKFYGKEDLEKCVTSIKNLNKDEKFLSNIRIDMIDFNVWRIKANVLDDFIIEFGYSGGLQYWFGGLRRISDDELLHINPMSIEEFLLAVDDLITDAGFNYLKALGAIEKFKL